MAFGDNLKSDVSGENRDEHGRWTSGGASGRSVDDKEWQRELAKHDEKAANLLKTALPAAEVEKITGNYINEPHVHAVVPADTSHTSMVKELRSQGWKAPNRWNEEDRVSLSKDGHHLTIEKHPSQHIDAMHGETNRGNKWGRRMTLYTEFPGSGIDLSKKSLDSREGTVQSMDEETDDMLVSFGGEIKSLGDGKFSGFLIRYTSADDPDLTNDYFTKSTELYVEDGTVIPVLYDHGLNPTLKARKIGRATVYQKDAGLWVEGELNLRDDYEKAINEKLLKAGKAGLSSGAARHMMQRKSMGNGVNEITAWGIAECSITPCPTEHRNEAYASLKSYTEEEYEDPLDNVKGDVSGDTLKTIRKEGDKFCLYASDGKKLGEHDTMKEAEAQETAINISKAKAKDGKSYDPSEDRDSTGKWTSGGGSHLTPSEHRDLATYHHKTAGKLDASGDKIGASLHRRAALEHTTAANFIEGSKAPRAEEASKRAEEAGTPAAHRAAGMAHSQAAEHFSSKGQHDKAALHESKATQHYRIASELMSGGKKSLAFDQPIHGDGRAFKGAFDKELQERKLAFYELGSALCEEVKGVVNAASPEVTEVTGVPVDVEGKITEAVVKYAARLIPLLVGQAQDFLSSPRTGSSNYGPVSNNEFYVKSFAINGLHTFLKSSDALVSGVSLNEHSSRVVSASEEFVNIAVSFLDSFKSWGKRITDKAAFRAADATKSGRMISAANKERLRSALDSVDAARPHILALLDSPEQKDGEAADDSAPPATPPKEKKSETARADLAESLVREHKLRKLRTETGLAGLYTS